MHTINLSVMQSLKKCYIRGDFVGIEILFKIATVGILASVINQILKYSGKDEIATLTTLAGVVVVLFMIVDMVSELFATVKNLFNF